MSDEPLREHGPFTWVNGVALFLALLASLFFLITLLRYASDDSGISSILGVATMALYALGLVVGVILIRPRPRHRRLFGWLFIPFFVQFLLYALGWYEAAGFRTGLHPMEVYGLMVAAFFGGWPFLGPLIPCTRRWQVLAFTETVLMVLLAVQWAAHW